MNPLKLQCNKANCRKIINIRENTIFDVCPHTPISFLIYAIEEFIAQEKNAAQVIEILNERYNLSSCAKKSIYKLFYFFRQCISQYYKEVYLYEKLAYENENNNIGIEESVFIRDENGVHEWLVGLIDITNGKVRFELLKERNADIMKKIVKHHVGEKNTIISDGWEGYTWLRNEKYEHIRHIHGVHDFGRGSESTSHIESVWATLKRYISKLYTALNQKNFIYYVIEIEFRYNVRNKIKTEKINELIGILQYCKDTCKLEFYSKDYLIDIDKNLYNDSSSDEEDSDDESDDN